MRGEIKRLHQAIATTMIYVTHDQIEAMTLADRIVLMRDGRIEQQGAPLDLFERPDTMFVAGFLGSPKMTFLPGRLSLGSGEAAFVAKDGAVTFPLPAGRVGPGIANGMPVILGVRPEHVNPAYGPAPAPGESRLEAIIELLQPTGSRTYATFRIAGAPVIAELEAHTVSRPGETITLDLDLNRAALFDPATERALSAGTAPSPNA